MSSAHRPKSKPAVEMGRLMELLTAQSEALQQGDGDRLAALAPLLERQLEEIDRLLVEGFGVSGVRDEEERRSLRLQIERLQDLADENAAAYRLRRESVERARLQLRSTARFASQAFAPRRGALQRLDLQG